MEDLKTRFPRDMEYEVSLDTTLPVTEGINEIVHTLFEAVVLVIIVVFVFLQNWRATLIPLLTVPVSLVGAFMFFPLLGFSINVLSLLGLVLAIGIVVDDAIVVVEAVMHHIEHGMEPKEATLKAMEEVSGPVVAIALILIAVFVPVGFMGGITGRALPAVRHHDRALGAAVGGQRADAVAGAGGDAAQDADGQEDAADARSTTASTRSSASPRTATSASRRCWCGSSSSVWCSSAGSRYLTVGLVGRIPGGFVPEEDQGYILVNALLPDGASLERTDAVMKKAEQILAANHAIDGLQRDLGLQPPDRRVLVEHGLLLRGAQAVARAPHAPRSTPTASSRRSTGRSRGRFPEAVVVAFGPPAIPGLGTGAGFTMQLQDRVGRTPAYLAEQTARFMQAARQRPEIGRVSTLYRASVPQVYADIDRSKVLKLGAPLADVNNTLGALLGSTYVNDFNKFGRVYKVYVQAEPEYRRTRSSSGCSSCAAQNGRDGAARHAGDGRGRRAAPSSPTGSTSIARPKSPACRLRATARRRRSPRSRRWRRQTLPADMGYDWADMSYQEKRAPNPVDRVRARDPARVPRARRRSTRAGALPFSVLLGTPFAAFGAYFGLWVGAAVRRRATSTTSSRRSG